MSWWATKVAAFITGSNSDFVERVELRSVSWPTLFYIAWWIIYLPEPFPRFQHLSRNSLYEVITSLSSSTSKDYFFQNSRYRLKILFSPQFLILQLENLRLDVHRIMCKKSLPNSELWVFLLEFKKKCDQTARITSRKHKFQMKIWYSCIASCASLNSIVNDCQNETLELVITLAIAIEAMHTTNLAFDFL